VHINSPMYGQNTVAAVFLRRHRCRHARRRSAKQYGGAHLYRFLPTLGDHLPTVLAAMSGSAAHRPMFDSKEASRACDSAFVRRLSRGSSRWPAAVGGVPSWWRLWTVAKVGLGGGCPLIRVVIRLSTGSATCVRRSHHPHGGCVRCRRDDALASPTDRPTGQRRRDLRNPSSTCFPRKYCSPPFPTRGRHLQHVVTSSWRQVVVACGECST